MERVKVLIDKLVQQQQRNESVETMLITTQLLQNELLLFQRKNTAPVTSKVAVVMPSSVNPIIKREPKPVPAPAFVAEEPTPVQEEPASVEKEIPAPEQRIEELVPPVEEPNPEPVAAIPPIYKVPSVPHMSPAPVKEESRQFQQPEPVSNYHEPVLYNNIREEEPAPVLPSPVMEAPVNPEHEAYLPPKQKVQETTPEPEKIVHPLVLENPFDAMEDTPTLAQYQPSKKDLKLQKEINDLIGEQKETLNERLKENKKELAHMLKETPIKDLRKAIGVNDRFVFVNELFRGDETMYERSIKTINGFHILPEAEYWINRELKVKLGWDDYKDSVQHFYHLVRRRFS